MLEFNGIGAFVRWLNSLTAAERAERAGWTIYQYEDRDGSIIVLESDDEEYPLDYEEPPPRRLGTVGTYPNRY